MLSFTSQNYLIFLSILLCLYYYSSARLRPYLLLSASILFYAFLLETHLLFVLVTVILLNYFCGLLLMRCRGSARTLVFVAGIAGNIFVLAAFKYFPAHIFGDKAVGIVSIIGVSYYVLQALSYLIDIYAGDEIPERHLSRFALYLAFFPKLLQGPIERARNLLPQLVNPATPVYEDLRAGAILFVWGVVKKAVIADRLAEIVNVAYGAPASHRGFYLIVATWCYALQIYFDFSGYTDMALGSARLFGIRLTQNFDNPYFSKSIGEFWRRWHISFSSWLLDYIFMPLQMLLRYRGRIGVAVALLVTFLVSGIWHGATSGFIVWGLMHGCYLAFSVYSRPWQKKFQQSLALNGRLLALWQVFWTFNLVCLAWVFFRAGTAGQGIHILAAMLPKGIDVAAISAWLSIPDLSGVVPALLALVVVLFLEYRRGVADIPALFSSWRPLARWAMYYAMLTTIFLYGVFADSEFLYFRF